MTTAGAVVGAIALGIVAWLVDAACVMVLLGALHTGAPAVPALGYADSLAALALVMIVGRSARGVETPERPRRR